LSLGASTGKQNLSSGLHYIGEALTDYADGNPEETYGSPVY